jgi:hypothetical protein
MKKQQNLKRRLKLDKDTLVRLAQPELQQVAGGGPSGDSCFPDICQEKDSSAC